MAAVMTLAIIAHLKGISDGLEGRGDGGVL
jgi:hypothetical protein